MEKNTSKKFLAGILALSAGFILASCDPVSAIPKGYNNPIVVNNDGSTLDLDKNIVGELYDSIASDRNEKLVSNLLKKVAENKFGTYHELLVAKQGDAAQRKAFTDKYSDYFGTDEAESAVRFEEFVEDVKLRISEYFYKEITSGSYYDDLGRFDEEKLYKAHRYELYDLYDMPEAVRDNEFFVDYKVTKDNAINPFKADDEDCYLRGTYHNTEEGKRGYIEEKVYPDILKDKLVEDYIYTNNKSSLGRAYARKVAYVKVPYEVTRKNMGAMVSKFADKYILKAAESTSKADEAIDFELLNHALKGYTEFNKTYLVNSIIKHKTEELESKVFDLHVAAYGSTYETVNVPDDANYKYEGIKLVEPGEYCKETKLGKILESYSLAIVAEGQRFPSEALKKELDSFTENGKSKEYGLMQKLLSLSKEDYTTDGWYVKNGGISELPSDLRDRLFNIRIADNIEKIAKEAEAGPVATTEKRVYLRNIKGRKVILPKDAPDYTESEPFNYVYEDTDGKALYICQVLEAPSTAKLADDSQSYSKMDKESISRQIAKILGTKDSYIKDAYTECINKYYKDFEFFDTSFYEYLKGEYPDLDVFEE